jgi:hypothetical protein
VARPFRAANVSSAALQARENFVTFSDFKSTLKDAAPPRLVPTLVALWHDARGDWDAAHGVVQDIAGVDAAWVHAYLHRKEGDLANARYWYRQAERPESTAPLAHEWEEIATSLLHRA